MRSKSIANLVQGIILILGAIAVFLMSPFLSLALGGLMSQVFGISADIGIGTVASLLLCLAFTLLIVGIQRLICKKTDPEHR